MKTFLKLALAVAGIAALLFVALVVTVTLLLDPNDYRPYIVDAVEQATGRPFELEGDLGLDVIPCCSVSLGPSRLGSPAGFADADFAALDAASLSLRLWPLLIRREVHVDSVTLEGLDVSLLRQADGRVNWTFDDAAAAETPPADPAAPLSLSVERIVLRDGQVRYQDRTAEQDYAVRGLTLDTRLALNDDRLTVMNPQLALTVTGTGLPDAVDVALALDTLNVDMATAEEATVAGLRLDVRTLDSNLLVTGGGRAGAELALAGEFSLADTVPREVLAALSPEPYQPAGPRALQRLSARGNWALEGNALSVDALAVQLDDSTLTGSAGVADLDSGAVRFDLALDQIDVDAYLAPADSSSAAAESAGEPTVLPLAALAEVPLEGRLRIGRVHAAGLDIADVALALTSRDGNVRTSLSAAALGGTLKVDGNGDVAGPQPSLGGRVQIDGMTPRTALAAMGTAVATADPNVLQRLTASADWRLTPRTAALDKLRIKLDDTTLTGTLSVTDFDSAAARFDLAVDRMNLDGYLPPDSEQPEAPETEESPIPVELIRELNLDGRLRVAELVFMEMTLRDVLAEVRAADGVLRLDPLSAGLYGGAYRGSIAVDATGSTARVTLDQELAAVQVNELLQQFFDSDLLDGSLSLELSGSGTGNTPSELLRGLAADVTFDLSDGVYRGMNVLYQLQKARATLKNEPPPAPPENPETAIRALHASGRMVDGILQTRQLTAETDALGLSGTGGINLLELVLDYDLSARVLGGTAAAAKLGDLASASIPLRIEGPLRAPRVGVDLKGMLTNSVRDTVQTKAREALLERRGGGTEPQSGDAAGAPATASGGDAAASASTATPSPDAATTDNSDKPSTRDLLKQGLRDLLKAQDRKAAEQAETTEQSPDS